MNYTIYNYRVKKYLSDSMHGSTPKSLHIYEYNALVILFEINPKEFPELTASACSVYGRRKTAALAPIIGLVLTRTTASRRSEG